MPGTHPIIPCWNWIGALLDSVRYPIWSCSQGLSFCYPNHCGLGGQHPDQKECSLSGDGSVSFCVVLLWIPLLRSTSLNVSPISLTKFPRLRTLVRDPQQP